MKSAFRHLIENPFITATGAAALVHSTWSLGTLMSGTQPDAGLTVGFLGWLIPALLIAFALDVGQIVTSARIRHSGMTIQMAVTFGVFSFATYYLQLLYMIHHVPELALASGVRGEWSGMVTLIRDASIWLIPALLPLSTLLYTLSADNRHQDAPGAPSVHVESVMPTIWDMADTQPLITYDEPLQIERGDDVPPQNAQWFGTSYPHALGANDDMRMTQNANERIDDETATRD